MNPATSQPCDNIYTCAVIGATRGAAVQTLVSPLDAVKTRQQMHDGPIKARDLAMHMWKNEGLPAFYRGFKPQVIKSSFKQLWSWPLMIYGPVQLANTRIDPKYFPSIIAFSSATVDILAAPIERWRVKRILHADTVFSFKEILQEGKQAVRGSYPQSLVSWTSFLNAHQYFRNQELDKKVPISTYRILLIGFKVAFVVSICNAPFDIRNTQIQGQNQFVLNGNSILSCYFRGWPLSFSVMLIHNSASAFLFHRFDQKSQH